MPYLEKVQCPSCGASTDVKSPSLLQATCEYCDTIFTFDKEGARDSGIKSKLIPPISGLSINTDIKISGKKYTVLGRVQYGYSLSKDETTGLWEEWYLGSDAGDIWLTEDAGNFIFETSIENKTLHQKIKTGESIQIQNSTYLATETGDVYCKGTAGMLPFTIIPDETYYYVDARKKSGDGPDFISIEYDEDTPSIFTGKNIDPVSLEYKKDDSFLKAGRTDSIALRCNSCGSPLTTSGKVLEIKTITCASCGTINQIDRETTISLGEVANELGNNLTLPLNGFLKLNNIDYTITGRLCYEWEDEGETGETYEYLLYNPEKGYLYIGEEDDEFTAFYPTHPPKENMASDFSTDKEFIYENDNYIYEETGYLKLIYVDGALPFITKIGSKIQFTDASSEKGVRLSEEVNFDESGEAREIEHFLGEEIPYSEIVASFPELEKDEVTYTPYKPLLGELYLKILSIVFSIGFFIYGFILDKSESILRESYTQQDLLKKELFTDVFEIDKKDEAIEVIVSTDVDQTWTHLGIALYQAGTESILTGEDMGIEYYSGVEDGESWSEGAKSESIFWKIKEVGKYKLLITALDGDTSPYTKINIEVHKNAIRYYPFIIMSLVWLIFPIALYLRKETWR